MRISSTLLFAWMAVNSSSVQSEPADACVSVFEKAEQEQVSVPNGAAIRGVVGAGRLYFHTAPDKRCQLKDLFVIPGDRLEAYADYGEFTSVIYWNPLTGAGTAGWVLSSRVTEARTNVASARITR